MHSSFLLLQKRYILVLGKDDPLKVMKTCIFQLGVNKVVVLTKETCKYLYK